MKEVCKLPEESGLYQIVNRAGNRYWLRCEVSFYSDKRSVRYAVYDPSSWDELTTSFGAEAKDVQAKFHPVSFMPCNITVTTPEPVES